MITRFRRIVLASVCLFSPAHTLADPAVSWGADFTSNYVFDGLTQSNSGFAFQPWAEVENRGYYAGVWASNVDLGTDNWEIDLLLGYRKTHENGLFWDVGGSWLFNEPGSADVLYYGADAGDEGGVVTMSLGF